MNEDTWYIAINVKKHKNEIFSFPSGSRLLNFIMDIEENYSGVEMAIAEGY